MLDFIRAFLEADNLAPHGMCLLWRPELVWTHVISDAATGLAYFSIPVALAAFLAKRRDVAFGWMVWCFAAFILACGTTHLFSIWTLWRPDYGTQAVVKAFTAAISAVTAVALWRLLPQALALPSPEQLRRANDALRAYLAERDAALEALNRETAERRKAEEMLRQSQKMEAVGQLTGGVAHDFNNLMTVVIGNLERIERRMPESGEDVRRAIASAKTGADRAAALTQQLLAFARKQPLDPQALSPENLLEGVGDLLRRTIGERIVLETRVDPDVPPILVDRNGLENVILNLAANARDAMPDGGRLTVAVRLPVAADLAGGPGSPGDSVVVEVADTGRGMDEEVARRAFEPFFTTKPIGQGTGLGLSQVYGFVTQSGGHATLESSHGKGTTVRLLLPRADRQRAPGEDQRTARRDVPPGLGDPVAAPG